MSVPFETELKFEVLPAKAAALRARRLEPLGGGPGTREHLSSTYFDTPKQLLRRKGLSLRIRRAGERRVQTIKEAGVGGAGLFARPEWETEVDGDGPDLVAASGTPVGAVLADRPAGALRPVFTTEFERTSWTVETADATIAMSLDEGHVSADGASRPIAEVELELKRGRPAALFGLVRALGGPDLMRIGVATKSEQGYGLAGGPQGCFKAERLALAPDMSAGEAFAAILRACLRHLGRNVPPIVEGRSVEAVHQARVALRRLRSALSLFRAVVADGEVGALRRRLKAVSDRLGEARNLDVSLARLAEVRGEGGDDGAHERLVLSLSQRREAAYAKVVALLGSKRFRALMLDLLAWSETGPWRRPEAPKGGAPKGGALRDRPVGTVAAAILKAQRRRVKRRGRHLRRLDPAARHEVRIAAKTLRYAAEFFAGLVERPRDRRRHEAFLGALEDLQEDLGALNDIETGRALLGDGEAAARWLGAGPDREEGLVASAARAHRALAKAKPFWTEFA